MGKGGLESKIIRLISAGLCLYERELVLRDER